MAFWPGYVTFELSLKGAHLVPPFEKKGSLSNLTSSRGREPLDF
jgi:hypothetical protein